jgi:hypothetical protein
MATRIHIRRIMDHFTETMLKAHAEDATRMQRALDPFLVENDCTRPEGHEIVSTEKGEIICSHCHGVFWA